MPRSIVWEGPAEYTTIALLKNQHIRNKMLSTANFALMNEDNQFAARYPNFAKPIRYLAQPVTEEDVELSFASSLTARMLLYGTTTVDTYPLKGSEKLGDLPRASAWDNSVGFQALFKSGYYGAITDSFSFAKQLILHR